MSKSHGTFETGTFCQTGTEREERKNTKHCIRLMSQYPAKSGWILLLQNRLDFDSIGNKRLAIKVYYNCRTKMIGNTPDTYNTHFCAARLKNHQSAAGWMKV